jgi:hypothetical protein
MRIAFKLSFCIYLFCSAFFLIAEDFYTLKVTFDQKILQPAKKKEPSWDQLERLCKELSQPPSQKSEGLSYDYFLKEVDVQEQTIELQDGSLWSVSYLSSTHYKNWKAGDRLKVYYEPGFFYDGATIENQNRHEKATVYLSLWPEQDKEPYIAKIPNYCNDQDAGKKIILSQGEIFLHSTALVVEKGWKPADALFIYHSRKKGSYDIYHRQQKQITEGWRLIGNDGAQNTGDFASQILNLENYLNQKVIAQENATEAVSRSILNYAAGLKDPSAPIGCFLFLGPTGVGKTELAKALCLELFKDYSHLIRFDMSQFNLSHTASRLIGSPPGYVNHEEGGQLTNALRNHPNCVVLLDEIEKAHPDVQKVFLPIFDEGYVTDNKGRNISCKNAVFIMTSNLCSQKISDYGAYDLEADEILELIEAELIERLSPELYNRLEPVVFKSLSPEAMGPIVDLMLKEVMTNLQKVKRITLSIDPSVRQYLAEHGYHPKLGARPLKKLIKNTVVLAVSKAILQGQLPEGSHALLCYESESDFWQIQSL